MPKGYVRPRERHYDALRDYLRLPPLNATTVAFAVFALVVALTGGSSRPDNVWLLVLRPVTVLCLVVMLLPNRINWRSIRPLPLLIGLFATTIAMQLVPLPPSFWYGLAGRENYDAVAQALGGTDRWHPLAIAPDRAWNSLVSLLVPLAALIGFASLDDRQRYALLCPMLALVVLTMVLGLAQIASGGNSLLYWYEVSGRGQLIGLLANRNHQGTFLALALPLLRAWTIFPAANRGPQRTRNIVGLCAAAIVILYILVLGSRAGVVLTLVGLVAAFLVEPSIDAGRLPRRQRWLPLTGLAAGIAGLLALALTANRAVSIGRFLDSNELGAEGRLRALPTLLDMVTQAMPLGTGFGSFVPVFASYEPKALLTPYYFNNAHNDLIELAITGGLPALIVFLAFLVWFGWASWRCAASPTPSRQWRALHRASAFGILIVLLASVTDYPLRTPLLGAVFTILCCWFAHTPAEVRPNAD